jgi:hypothetical protein
MSLNLEVERMRLLRGFLTLSLSFSILCLSVTNSYSEAIWWNDYREPLSNVKVIHDESATIYVDIPEVFFANKEEITLVVTVKSNVYLMEALKRELSFHLFYPSITVNDKLFGTYRISVTELPGVQTRQIKIKTKHLKSGKNKLKARYNWRQQGNYCVGRCSYTIKEISFKDNPPLVYNLAVSSIPAEADIYLDEKYYGKTPKKLEIGKGWHNIKIEKAGYQFSIDDIKVFEDDEYFIELEGKIGQRSEEEYDGHWIGEARHITAYGETGVPCRDASIDFHISGGTIEGRSVSSTDTEYELNGMVSEEGKVTAGTAVGGNTVVSFKGELSKESGTGSWETLRKCSGTWHVRRKLE